MPRRPRLRPTDDLQGAERLARYLTRGPLPLDVVEKVEGGRLRVRTPPDPRTGLADKILIPFPPGPEPVTMYFQARLLKLVDAPRLAGWWFEQAVAGGSDQNVRRQVTERAFPEAA